MESPLRRQEGSGSDVVIPFSRYGSSSTVRGQSIMRLQFPYVQDMPTPILGLSDSIPEVQAFKSFPFLIDIFHESISRVDSPPPKCSKCGSYLPDMKECPFCTIGAHMSPSFVRFPMAKFPSTFVFVIVGEPNPSLYTSLSSFNYPFILASFDSALSICVKTTQKYSHLQIIDSAIPPNAILTSPSGIPPFPRSQIKRGNLQSIESTLSASLSSFAGLIHIIFIVSVPHECISAVHRPQSTVTVLSTNSIECGCLNACRASGGLFLPNFYSLSIPTIATVRTMRIQTPYASIQKVDPCLAFPGQLLFDSSLNLSEKTASFSIQYFIQTDSEGICLSIPMTRKPGIRAFLSNSCLPLFLSVMGSDFEGLKSVLSKYSVGHNEIVLPWRLQFCLHFFPFYPFPTIHRVLHRRVFAVQYLPTYRVLESVDGTICTSLSLILFLYEYSIYVFIGGDVNDSALDKWIGFIPISRESSFQMQKGQKETAVWNDICTLQSLYSPMEIPIVGVPGESGRRVQLVDILKRCGEADSRILQLYSSLADSIR